MPAVRVAADAHVRQYSSTQSPRQGSTDQPASVPCTAVRCVVNKQQEDAAALEALLGAVADAQAASGSDWQVSW